MSLLLGIEFLLIHLGEELVEEVVRVVRAAARFGVELHGEGVQPGIVDAFAGVVVGVDEGDLPTPFKESETTS